jgi:hypothetical protein
VRAAQLLPASDASVQFSKSTGSVYAQTPYTSSTTGGITNGTARYAGFAATYDGTLGSVSLSLSAGYTGNMKCTLFSAILQNLTASSGPNAVLASATTVTNPATGSNTFTFSSPPTLVKGTYYFIGFDPDTTSGTWSLGGASGSQGVFSNTAYASFPIPLPGFTNSQNPPIVTLNIAVSGNYDLVQEAQQDGTTSYVYDNTVGHADFYNLSAVPTTSTVTSVTTRGFIAKSDVGARSAQVQLVSAGTTVQSTPLILSTSFQWAYRTDTVDPHTNSAWTATNVNAITVGPLVTS